MDKHACVLSRFSRAWHFETLWTVARQVPLSMGFSRQGYWSGLPCPPPEIQIHSSWGSCIAGGCFPAEPPGKPQETCLGIHFTNVCCLRSLTNIEPDAVHGLNFHMFSGRGIFISTGLHSVKESMQETRVRSLGWEDPLEWEMATHSSILAWKIPWTEESGRLQSMGSQSLGHNWANETESRENTKHYK